MNCNLFYQPVALSRDIPDQKLVQVWYRHTPVVLVRINKAVHAYEDYCPHRGVPLSKGFLLDKQIHCAYHGWSFDCTNGLNTFVPVKNEAVDCRLKALHVVEKYDAIWLSDDETSELPFLSDDKPSILSMGSIKAKMANVIENFLEGSHTHYIHDGLVRSKNKSRQEISAELVPNALGFKVYYARETSKGFLTKILPGKYQQLQPVATYIYPNITILEYFNRHEKVVSRFEGIISESKNETKFFARIFLNFGMASPLVSFFSKFIFSKIIDQDKKILEIQDHNLNLFPGNRFVSEQTDIVGQQIFAWLHDEKKILTNPVHFKVSW